MKGLIFSEVTIEEQIVWPKADSGPQKTRKKIVCKVQQQENIYRITLHFLVRKKIKLQNLIERGETKEEGWLSNKPRKDQNPSPLPWGEKKRLGCLLLLLEVVPMWSGESRQLLALSQCSCRTRRSSDSPGRVCLCRSQVSCEAKPSQGYCFIDRQIRIENHE